MIITSLALEGLKLIQLKVYGDKRGFFVERFHHQKFQEAGLPVQFLQDNHSRSAPGVLRGLHFQSTPAQGKLVGVARGKIWDVAVDIRNASPTFGKYFGVELSDENGKLLWIPPGFAHGFCVLGEESADVLYKVDGYYNPRSEGGIAWNDPELCIPWPNREDLQKEYVVSERDRELPSFSKYKENPIF